jgi:ferredoxin-type protein NapH
MISLIKKNRFLILRRIIQISIMLLFITGNVWDWKILQGDLSSSKLFDSIYLNDPFAILQMFISGALVSFELLIGALIVLIFYMIMGNRIFCSYVCPVNMITDLANYLRRKLSLDNIQKKQPASRNIRYWVLSISLILSFIMGISAFEFISPISITHRAIIFGLGFGWSAMLVIFLFDLVVLKNGWCGHICPLGGFYALTGKVGLFKIKHNVNNCTSCMKCKVVCPEMQVLKIISKKSGDIQSSECISCSRCIEVCDDNALSFSIRDFNNKKKG